MSCCVDWNLLQCNGCYGQRQRDAPALLSLCFSRQQRAKGQRGWRQRPFASCQAVRPALCGQLRPYPALHLLWSALTLLCSCPAWRLLTSFCSHSLLGPHTGYADFWCSRACARRSDDAECVDRLFNSPRSGVCGYRGPLDGEEGEEAGQAAEEEGESSGEESGGSEEEDSSEEEGSSEEDGSSEEENSEEEDSGSGSEEEEEEEQPAVGRRGRGVAAASGRAKPAAKPAAAAKRGAKPAARKAAGKAAGAIKAAPGRKAAAQPAAAKKAAVGKKAAAKPTAGKKPAAKPAAGKKAAAKPAAAKAKAAGQAQADRGGRRHPQQAGCQVSRSGVARACAGCHFKVTCGCT